MMSDMIVKLRQYLDKPLTESRTITSIASLQFWICFGLIVLSACTFARDPLFFDEKFGFKYGCGVLSIMVSYIVLSALFWELMLFGKSKGANLFLQCAIMIPFTLFMSRAFLPPPQEKQSQTLLDVVWGSIQKIDQDYLGVSDVIQKILPSWVLDVFSHWSITMVLLFVVIALCFKKKECKIGLLFTSFLVGVAGAVSTAASWQFVLGMLLLVAVFVLMYNPVEEQLFYHEWMRNLSREPIDETTLDFISTIMSETYKRGRLSDTEYRSLLGARPQCVGLSSEDLSGVCGKLRELLLVQKEFICITADSSGNYLTISPKLLNHNTWMNALSIYPRMVIVSLIGLIWLISPLDIVPDALPFIGQLDDVVIAILSMKCVSTSSRRSNILND